MNEPENHNPPQGDRDYLAAEYALGVASDAARGEARRRIEADQDFARDVEGWQHLLTPLAEAVAPVTPSPGVWQRIEAGIEAEHTQPVFAFRPARRLWRSLSFWRGFGFGSMALAAASLTALAIFPPRLQSTEPATTTISAIGNPGPAGIIAALDPRARRLLIVPAAPSASQEWVPELWLILPTGVSRSLGIVNPEQPTEINLPPELAEQVDRSSTLAISLEPVGGSPTGSPTGPVIAQGTLHRL